MNKTFKIFNRLSKRYSTPQKVQKLLASFTYNSEPNGDTMNSALSTYKLRTAHCLEGALLAAAILEHREYPPLLLSLESKDNLDHVLFLFQKNNKWGAVGISRCDGLRGRAPVFKNIRDLVYSYVDPFVDLTGRVTKYAVADLRDMKFPWRDSRSFVWSVEDYLIDHPHKRIKTSNARYKRALRRFKLTGEGGIPSKIWW